MNQMKVDEKILRKWLIIGRSYNNTKNNIAKGFNENNRFRSL
jgi:hypothetical protein